MRCNSNYSPAMTHEQWIDHWRRMAQAAWDDNRGADYTRFRANLSRLEGTAFSSLSDRRAA